jgi:hypothetical protein
MPAHHGTSQHPPIPARWPGWLGTGRSGQTRRSHCGGARLGCAGSTGSAVWWRCSRIRSMTAGCSMLAITRSLPLHCRQVSMSMAKTRLRRCAHDIARCRSLTEPSPRAAKAAVRVPGTICARSGLAGANTLWYRGRCARGFGTSAARRAIKSSGSKITCVVPSRYGVFSA